MMDVSSDVMAIQRNDHEGFPVSTSQNATVNAPNNPYIDPITTLKDLMFFMKSPMKNKLNNGAIKSPFVFAVTSIMLPGTAGIIKLSKTTSTPIAALLIRTLARVLFFEFNKRGIKSIAKTELVEFIPDDKLDIEAENNAAITSPDIPMGS